MLTIEKVSFVGGKVFSPETYIIAAQAVKRGNMVNFTFNKRDTDAMFIYFNDGSWKFVEIEEFWETLMNKSQKYYDTFMSLYHNISLFVSNHEKAIEVSLSI